MTNEIQKFRENIYRNPDGELGISVDKAQEILNKYYIQSQERKLRDMRSFYGRKK
jgi:hypothetical protein